MNRLSSIEQRVFELRAAGKSWAETADTLGITINAVLSAIGCICIAADAPTEAEALRKIANDNHNLEPVA
jgi:DNA-binding CsgD family transcriptional regulator